MDEPTAALAVAEQAKVLSFIRRLRDSGKAVVLISHNINDVLAVADRITVLRRGRGVGVLERGATSPEEVIGLITGARDALAASTQPKGQHQGERIT
jgi:ABC-type sugar transport system ATPase subunit